MKPLAFVIQRYGHEVNGGAEALCRQVAERLAPETPVEVLTTCARDYLTWADHYPPGREEIDGVGVRRFPVARQRRVRAFGRFSKKVYDRDHTFAQEGEWMDRQGPDVPELYRFIASHRDDYGLFVFFTYLYPPTFFGLPQVAEKSILVPMAHDEAPLRLGIFRSLFHLPRGFIFNTEEERRFVHETFRNDYLPWTVGGAGIDLPPSPPPSPPPAPAGGEYFLYLGRVDVEKGCGELIDFFLRHKKKHPSDVKLYLAGDVNMALPKSGDIVPLGYISDRSKATVLSGARALIVPSRHESLSLVALEAWAAGVPVIAHRGSRVLVEHVEESGGGWLYSGTREFTRCLDNVSDDADGRRRAGLAGRRYVARRYGWAKVLNSYRRFFRKMLKKVGADGANRD
jgi:glycosyltransferase involved in cell wall biosynthesis